MCTLGAQQTGFTKKSGCPNDSPGGRAARLAFPTCLGVQGTGSYHCVLTCGPCRQDDNNCLAQADDTCPNGAKCVVGLNRQVHFGTCVYPKKKDSLRKGTSM